MTTTITAPTRVAIVGAGHVGATFAYGVLLSGLAAEVVLIDTDRDRAAGEAMDLGHAVPFNRPARVWAGELADARGAALTVVTAGAGQRPGETRLDLAARNADVIRDVVPGIAAANPEGAIIVATNPVDVLTQVAQDASGLPHGRVIGSGTILDTARFRFLIGEQLAVDPRSVHGYIVGEHGDSAVPVWSSASAGGVPIEAFAAARGVAFGDDERRRIGDQVRTAAYEVIQRKGATYYAIASGLVRLVEAMLRDQRSVLSVSTRMLPEHGYVGVADVCLSVPCVIDRHGVSTVLRLELDPAEAAALQRSADVLAEARARVTR